MKIDKNWTNVVPTKASRVGGTRKVRDLDADETCTDPSHNPPGMMVYEDGHYEHTCPGCGHVTSFVVRKPRWRVELPKVREFFDQLCKLPQYHNEQGRDFLEGIYAELDAAEGKGEGRG